jgi:Uma2 family endonuclease
MTETQELEAPPVDLLAEAEKDGVELIDGRLVEKNMGAEAGAIAIKAILLIGLFLREHNIGHLFTADCGYQLFGKKVPQVRKPDVSFVKHGRLPDEKLPGGNIPFAPDLAVEVVSPNDLAEDVEKRINDFLTAGVPMLWMIYPGSRSVYVYRSGGVIQRLSGGEEISGGDVLPGFSCRVEELFTGV